MASERVQRRIERLLDRIDEAESRDDWESVRNLSLDVLEIDPDNSEVSSYLRSAERRLGAASTTFGEVESETSVPETGLLRRPFHLTTFSGRFALTLHSVTFQVCLPPRNCMLQSSLQSIPRNPISATG